MKDPHRYFSEPKATNRPKGFSICNYIKLRKSKPHILKADTSFGLFV